MDEGPVKGPPPATACVTLSPPSHELAEPLLSIGNQASPNLSDLEIQPPQDED